MVRLALAATTSFCLKVAVLLTCDRLRPAGGVSDVHAGMLPGLDDDVSSWMQVKIELNKSKPARDVSGGPGGSITMLPGYFPTEGGGLMGGHLDIGSGHGPAPPTNFPAGCKWTKPMRVAMMHVGKTAGASLQDVLMAVPLNWTHVHVEWHEHFFDPEDYDLFILAVRDPVDRTVSGFNWNHPVGGGSIIDPCWSTDGFEAAECKMYECFPELPGGVNHFAEAINSEGPCGFAARECLNSIPAKCAHLPRDHHWYFGTGKARDTASLVQSVAMNSSKHAFVISTENFSAGLEALKDWLCVPPEIWPEEVPATHSTYPRHNDTYLSPAGLDNLKNALSKEYFVLEQIKPFVDEWW